MSSPEIQPKSPEEVKQRKEEFVVPEKIQDVGVKPRQSQVKAQVTDDQGQQLVQTPQTKRVTIRLPKPQGQLTQMSSGAADDSATWFGQYWIRLLKKAALMGWNVVVGKKEVVE